MGNFLKEVSHTLIARGLFVKVPLHPPKPFTKGFVRADLQVPASIVYLGQKQVMPRTEAQNSCRKNSGATETLNSHEK